MSHAFRAATWGRCLRTTQSSGTGPRLSGSLTPDARTASQPSIRSASATRCNTSVRSERKLPSETYARGRALLSRARPSKKGSGSCSRTQEPTNVACRKAEGVCANAAGVVDDRPECPAGSKRVVDRHCRRIESCDRGVVGCGELSSHDGAEISERPELARGRCEAGWPEPGVAEELSSHRQLAGVPGQEREERNSKAAQGRAGTECELVDENQVRIDRPHDVRESFRNGLRFPEEVVSASLGLVSQCRDHSLARRGEERLHLRVCARRPHAAVAARSEGELDVLVRVGGDEGSKRLARGNDDPVPPQAECVRDCGERVPV